MRAISNMHVRAGQDRFGHERIVLGGLSLDIKVATKDTAGSLFVIEHITARRGGPPRHLHYEQDEWFYAIEGSFALEIGDECFELGPGDSVLAPRKVPHAWAFKGDGQGRLLIAFQPAGLMESFFEKLSEFKGVPVMEELKTLFATHGMEVVGPPLFSPNQ